MSKWVEIRDAVVDALQLDDVTEQVKEDLTKNMLDSGLPALEDVADTFVAKIQLQATEEKGWNKVRTRLSCHSSSKGRFTAFVWRFKSPHKNHKKKPRKVSSFLALRGYFFITNKSKTID